MGPARLATMVCMRCAMVLLDYLTHLLKYDSILFLAIHKVEHLALCQRLVQLVRFLLEHELLTVNFHAELGLAHRRPILHILQLLCRQLFRLLSTTTRGNEAGAMLDTALLVVFFHACSHRLGLLIRIIEQFLDGLLRDYRRLNHVARVGRAILAADLLATLGLLKYPNFVEHFEVYVDAVLTLLLEFFQLLKRENVLHVFVGARLRDLQLLTVRVQEGLQQAEVVHVFFDGPVTSERHQLILVFEVCGDFVDERTGTVAKIASRDVPLAPRRRVIAVPTRRPASRAVDRSRSQCTLSAFLVDSGTGIFTRAQRIHMVGVLRWLRPLLLHVLDLLLTHLSLYSVHGNELLAARHLHVHLVVVLGTGSHALPLLVQVKLLDGLL